MFTGPQPDTCGPHLLLPAYAHNDYRNKHAFFDALALGYRGVEADVFRAGTELLVGHDRSQLQPSHTLVRLYLDPLRARNRSCGYVLPDSTSFLLNIELKESDPDAFRLLVSQLLGYDELFRPSASGSPPPVQVILVGWWPSPDRGLSPWPDYLRIHLPMGDGPSTTDRIERSRIGLVSVDYGKVLKWRGSGPVPRAANDALTKARDLAAGFAVPLRVHHAAERRRVYSWLLSGGVALIGANDLARTRSLLQGLSPLGGAPTRAP